MTRLYSPVALFPGQTVTMTGEQSHYLKNVLRMGIGQYVNVFNEREGEWSSIIIDLSKNHLHLKVETQARVAVPSPDISLVFALIKHDPLTFLMEKATELGVRSFYPVRTEYCQITRLNHDRLMRNVIEGAQQCERFDVPLIHPLMDLYNLLELWNPAVPLVVAQERSEAPGLIHIFQTLPLPLSVGFLIGPEGGFSCTEMSSLKTVNFTRFITLGPRILRSETAALAMLAIYQALSECQTS